MNNVYISAVLIIIGLCMGSFAGATVWRLRARQLMEDKSDGEAVDKHEYATLLPLTEASFSSDRSRCLHCGHALRWYDLVPVLSWLSIRGKCRYCHVKIGSFEPLIEIGVASFFVVSYLAWPSMFASPLDLAQFILWLIGGTLLSILFAYDLKWYLLPNSVVFPLIAVGALSALLRLIESPNIIGSVVSLLVACAVLSGLYFLLWILSKGQWIGFGDVKLGLALALMLGEWPLAFITLFAANLIGCIIVVPAMLSGKITRKTRISFGPLLIGGYLIAGLWGYSILGYYLSFTLL